jgi:ABC-type multidrug transport system fused ATPase/permease subunit
VLEEEISRSTILPRSNARPLRVVVCLTRYATSTTRYIVLCADRAKRALQLLSSVTLDSDQIRNIYVLMYSRLLLTACSCSVVLNVILPFLSNWSAPLLQASGDTIHLPSILLSAFQQKDRSYLPLHRWRPEVIPEFFMALREEYRKRPKLVRTRSQEAGSTRHLLLETHEPQKLVKAEHTGRQSRTPQQNTTAMKYHVVFFQCDGERYSFSSPSSSYHFASREKGEVTPVSDFSPSSSFISKDFSTTRHDISTRSSSPHISFLLT